MAWQGSIHTVDCFHYIYHSTVDQVFMTLALNMRKYS